MRTDLANPGGAEGSCCSVVTDGASSYQNLDGLTSLLAGLTTSDTSAHDQLIRPTFSRVKQSDTAHDKRAPDVVCCVYIYIRQTCLFLRTGTE